MGWPRLEPRICPVCGVTFQPIQRKVKTCSDKCGYAYRNQQRAERRAAELAAFEASHPVTPCNTPSSVVTPEAVTQPPPEVVPFPEAEPPRWTPPDPPAPTGRTGRYETIVFIPDIHCGDHDEKAVALMLGAVKHIRPDRVIQLGDCLDFYGLSRFDKNPLRFAARVQYELDVQAELYRYIREIAPGALLQQIEGNHEARGIKFLWQNPALADLRALQLPNLMRLEELGWEPVVHQEIHLAGGAFVVRHGTHIKKWGGQSAKAELEATWLSGISGHTHRQALYPYTTPAGEMIWAEAGHLQKNPPEWRQSVQNWQQGLVIGEFRRDGNAFSLEPIRFRRSYKCRIGQSELSA